LLLVGIPGVPLMTGAEAYMADETAAIPEAALPGK